MTQTGASTRALLDFPGLVCPACRGDLAALPSGVLCAGCGRLYPVRDGLPVLIHGEAEPPK